MKDYQEKTIKELTDIYRQINALETPNTDMLARLQNLKNFKESSRLKEKAMILAANSQAYSLAKKYVNNVIQPALTILPHASVEVLQCGSIVLRSPSANTLYIMAHLKETYNQVEKFYEKIFIGFKMSPCVYKYTMDLNYYNDKVEEWIGNQL